MKKLLAAIMASVIFIFPLSLSSCSGGWQEIQSITYTTDTGSETLTSSYIFDYTTEDITEAEYNPDLQDQITISYRGKIPKNRKEFIDELSDNKNKVEHSHFYRNDEGMIANGPIDGYYEVFTKTTFFGYTIHYIQIKFYEDGSFELKYYENDDEKSVHILPSSYEITYFNS